MRIVLLVEGASEYQGLPGFLRRWLDPQLDRPVGISPVNLGGWKKMDRDLARHAKQHLTKGTTAGVIALMDLYGPDFHAAGTNVAKRYRDGQARFVNQVNDPRFRMHFAVHEVEAWLLAEPGLFPSRVCAKFQPSWSSRPEEVNFDQPPAKRLERLYRDYANRGYKKTSDTSDLLKRADPEIAAEKRPYLKELLDDLLELAQSSTG